MGAFGHLSVWGDSPWDLPGRRQLPGYRPRLPELQLTFLSPGFGIAAAATPVKFSNREVFRPAKFSDREVFSEVFREAFREVFGEVFGVAVGAVFDECITFWRVAR